MDAATKHEDDARGVGATGHIPNDAADENDGDHGEIYSRTRIDVGIHIF